MTQKEIENRVCQAIDSCKDQIVAIGRAIDNKPEMGFCEETTSALVRKTFEELGISFTYPHAMTGVKGKLKSSKPGPCVALMGEMDCVKCGEHPKADAENRVHACGHHGQVAALLGAAMGLKNSGIMDELSGSVALLSVPAEEFIDLDTRKKFRSEGKISFLSGKQEMIADGTFDDVDMALMIHAQPDEPEAKLFTRGHNLGFIAETITFHGKAAHGSTPYDGVNALNAASLAILGIHANRETFKDEDHIRIHPIITKGGDVVNVVPDEVTIDTYVRGASFEAMEKGAKAVERAVNGASTMIGTSYKIEPMPGYLPLYEDQNLSQVMEEVAKDMNEVKEICKGQEIVGSTDAGNLSFLMPVIQPCFGGFVGKQHSKEFAVVDEEAAFITTAKLMALTAVRLLCDDAARAKEIKKAFVPQMTKEEYLKFINQ